MKLKKKNQNNRKLLFTIGINKEIYRFIENLTLLVNSGMSIIPAIKSIASVATSKRMKKVLGWIVDDIEKGLTIGESLENTKLFKEHTISLIRLGEESGKLPENLKVISLEQEKERDTKSKIRSAMLYPVFVISVTALVGIGLAWFILPKLSTVFTQLNLELPAVTQFLINTGIFLDQYGVFVIPVFLFALILFFYLLFGNKKTKASGQTLIFSIPVIKKLIQEVEVARFGYLLGTLLDAGLPITKALNSVASATEFYKYKRLYLHLSTSIDGGNSFMQSFQSFPKADKLVPAPIQHLIVAGENSGELPSVLTKVGASLQAKSDISAKNLTTVMEPILLVIVWTGVLGVALAVILPIYNLIGGFNA